MRSAIETQTPAVAPEVTSVETLSQLFPEYEIYELLGRGGMGVVYRARHKKLARTVALKVLLPNLSEDPEFAARFTREAQAMARLDHPNVVGVHDFGEREGVFYLLMEFVDGSNLRELIDQGALTARDVLTIVPQICDALQFAHQRRVVHRDVKPENILVDEDLRVRIADFGLAKLMGGAADKVVLTRTEQVFGTPQYMAPEQMKMTAEVDHRADIYSLGVVLYEMLTGDLPIGRFAAPSAKGDVDESMDEVVLKSLESEPDKRYQSAEEVKTGVEGASIAATRPANTVPVRTRVTAQRGSLMGVAVASSTVVIASFTTWITVQDVRLPGGVVFGNAEIVRTAWDTNFFGFPCWLVVFAAVAFAGFYYARTRKVDVADRMLVLLSGCGGLFSLVVTAFTFASADVSPGPGSLLSTIAFGYLLHAGTPWGELSRSRPRGRRQAARRRAADLVKSQSLWVAVAGTAMIVLSTLLPWQFGFGNPNAFGSRNGLVLLYAIIYLSETLSSVCGSDKKPHFGITMSMAILGVVHSLVVIVLSIRVGPGPILALLTFGTWAAILWGQERSHRSRSSRGERRPNHTSAEKP